MRAGIDRLDYLSRMMLGHTGGTSYGDNATITRSLGTLKPAPCVRWSACFLQNPPFR